MAQAAPGATTRNDLTIRFEGDSGDGILSLGMIAARTASRSGLHVYTYSSYLAVVRGGQSAMQVRIGRQPLLSQGDRPDVLVALNYQAVRNHAGHVAPGGLILHPHFVEPIADLVNEGVRCIEVNFREVALEETGVPRGMNLVAAGAMLQLLGLEEQVAVGVVREQFAKKGPEVAELNVRALQAGYQTTAGVNGQAADLRLKSVDGRPRPLLSGNEAVAFGALVAGVRFFAGYPITPATEILEWLAHQLPRVGGRIVQAEDEIAALAMCIGAAFGGAKTMTATSGPGLSLMTELIGLAGMAELPIVIVDVQRAGPSTGMPTKEGQGDLRLAVHGTHGEVPRVVLAPQTVEDCFRDTIRAVGIAHQFHIPVIILSSQSLGQRMQTIDPPDLEAIAVYEEPFHPVREGEEFVRFAPTEDGHASPRTIPGMPGGMYRTGGLEHDESGNPSYEPEVRNRMVDRRRQRMDAIEREFRCGLIRDGHRNGRCPLGVVAWGSTASVVQEVVESLQREGWKIARFFPHILWPMPDTAFEEFLDSGIRTLFVCELNSTRQFAEMIQARYTARLIEHKIRVISITKDDGLPFTPEGIREGMLHHLSEKILRTEGLPFSPRQFKEMIFG